MYVIGMIGPLQGVWYVVLCMVFMGKVVHSQQSKLYFMTLEESGISCRERCNVINGTCREGYSGRMSQNRHLCMREFRFFLHTNNIKFADDPVVSTVTGGCVARNGPGYIEVQTRTLSHDCAVTNPPFGGWHRLCPCDVFVALEIPSPVPTALPSELQGILNTLYIIGTNVSQLEATCGLDQFETIIGRSVAKVLEVNDSDIGAVQAYDLLLVGLEFQVVAVSFEVKESSVVGGADGIDSALNSAIRHGDLLAAIKFNAGIYNCSLDMSSIGGFNGDIPGYTVDPTKSSPCTKYKGAEWDRLYGSNSYGPWAVVIVIMWSGLLMGVLFLSTKYTSCISYGITQSPRIKYIWALIFAAVSCRLIVASVVLTAWNTTDRDRDNGEGFACAELEGYTPSDVSVRSVQALLLLFYALLLCILAGINHYYHGDSAAASAVATTLSCIAFGPYVWLLVILYFILSYSSMDILSEQDRRTGDIAVQAVTGGMTAVLAALWMVDVFSDPRQSTLLRYVTCALAFMIYGILLLITCFVAVSESPGPSLVVKNILLHIFEIIAAGSALVCLLNALTRRRHIPSGATVRRPSLPASRPKASPSGLFAPDTSNSAAAMAKKRRFQRSSVRKREMELMAAQEHKGGSEESSNNSTISTIIDEDKCGIRMVPSMESGSSAEITNILRDPYQGRGGELLLGELTITDDADHADDYEDTIAYFGL